MENSSLKMRKGGAGIVAQHFKSLLGLLTFCIGTLFQVTGDPAP